MKKTPMTPRRAQIIRPRGKSLSMIGLTCLIVFIMSLFTSASFATDMFITDAQIQSLVADYAAAHANADMGRFERGVRQAAQLWRQDDGSAEEFARFCSESFIADSSLLRQTADRLETALASIYGHLSEMDRDLSWNLDVETGPILPIDYTIATYAPYAHVDDDMFKTRIGFIVLLNYPLYTLDDMLKPGPSWTRDQWAQARLAQRFSERIPAEVSQKTQRAYLQAGDYIQNYNIWMHHLIDKNGKRPFPAGMKLILHWNLRDELKSQYSAPDGLAKQEMIYNVMLKIIRQDIPQTVINNPAVDWKPASNQVVVSSEPDGSTPPSAAITGQPGDAVDNSPEPDTRYERLLGIFHAQQMLDPYYPTMPTLIERRFQRSREIPEAQVEQLFLSILSSKEVARTGRLIEKRLGRNLRPFDIWYDGFKIRSTMNAAVLDSMVRAKYPAADAFKADMPRILTQLGFDDATAIFLTSRVEVDPSRGAGHASGPGRSVDNAHLRTRVNAGGMDYKGYNIAVHEFGHNVEQVFSGCRIDHTLLAGVPNTAFTEAFAFVFQARDLDLLGIENKDPHAEQISILDDFWGTYEIAGVSLVDMRVWHWMYNHPDATAPQLKEAVISIAKDVWNQYYAPIFGEKDIELLAVYSHMINSSMYLPDYPLGGIISFQIEQYLKSHTLGPEMERMCLQGSITPNQWMRGAVGSDISTQPMLDATRKALDALGT